MTPPVEPQSRRAAPQWGLVLICAVGILAVAVSAMADVTAYLAHSRANRDYRPIQATVTQSESQPVQVRSSKVAANRTAYEPVITYKYVVAGQTYETSERQFDGATGDWDEAAANEECRRHPVGSTQQVFYDPDAPARAMWEKTPPHLDWMDLATDGLLVAVAVVVLVNALKGRVPLQGRSNQALP